MRAGRALSTLLLLQTRGRLSASTLAGLLEVSVRTVHRDIEHLSAAGVPVYAVRGRDGGFELLGGWRTQLTGLTGGEAEALFLSGLPGLARSLGLGGLLDRAELKLLVALTSDEDTDPLRVRARFHLDPTRWFADEESVPLLRVLSEATWRDERIRIRYESWTNTSDRVVSPLGIVVKAGAWYLVASAGDGPRTFRVSQVLEAEPTGERFEHPADFDLARYWSVHTGQYERGRYPLSARVRASPAGLARLRRSANVVAGAIDAAELHPDTDGWVDVTVPIESLEHATDDLLGDDIVVMSPPELRRRVGAAARQLADVYRDDGHSGAVRRQLTTDCCSGSTE